MKKSRRADAMLSISLRFPAGRYHATPWDRHVNDGEVERPPSPWRLYRALIATWHFKAKAEISESLIERIISKLAEDAPLFYVPPSSMAHTRHYMPLGALKQGKLDTTMIFDAFIRVPSDATLFVSYPKLELDSEERIALNMLLKRMNYLGRAESWVDACISNVSGSEPNCKPSSSSSMSIDHEHTRILSPEPGYPIKKLLEGLTMDTSDMKKHGWTMPPGAAWIQYSRPKKAIPETRRIDRSTTDTPSTAVYTVSSDVMPSISSAHLIAERVHRSLVSLCPTAVFTGCDNYGNPLADDHGHARIFCEAGSRKPKSSEITRITIYSSSGFGKPEQEALSKLEKVWGKGGHDIQLVLLYMGGGIGPKHTTWKSITPFVPTRHPKITRAGKAKTDASGTQIGSAEHDLRRLILMEGLPEPVSIEKIERAEINGCTMPWWKFATKREGGGKRAGNSGYGFRIKFKEPVAGPISLGYGCHFGLGLFVPETESRGSS